ncbi:MAG: sigma-54-dependent Fis family transcriptional regulator [Nitrospirae bacterium]|nr:sigma-54-dependent Fis family transcriptional regulator [Nitrospirota bacterium]
MKKKKILIVDDDELIQMVLTKALTDEGYEVKCDPGSGDIVNKIKSTFPDIVLLDVNLPEINGVHVLNELKNSGCSSQIVMLTADVSAETAVKAMKLGAADYLTKPFNLEEVKIVIQKLFDKALLEQEVERLRKTNSAIFSKELLGDSESIIDLKARVEKIAEARVSSVLITGESGCGKEIVARYIHRKMFGNSAEREPFISVNCAALPESILESELFGYEKGAFTDAKTDRKGVFELANGGTILLDEIGEMKPELQGKLLRVLEERSVRRVGGKEDMPIEVTVLATTNKNLAQAVKNGEFRSDLFFRLSIFYLHIPPLKERRSDIPLLAEHFLSTFAVKYNKKMIRGFSNEAISLMTAYDWPGNVRELRNLVERLVVLENCEQILVSHLPNWLKSGETAAQTCRDSGFTLPEDGVSLDDLEKNLIIQALERTNNNKTLAAKLLKISYDSFRYQIKKFGLD